MQALQPRNCSRFIEILALALAQKQKPYANIKMAIDPPRKTDLHCRQTQIDQWIDRYWMRRDQIFHQVRNESQKSMIWASILHLKCEKVVKFIVFIGIVRELPPPPLVILLGQLIVCTAHSHRHSQYYDNKEGRKHRYHSSWRRSCRKAEGPQRTCEQVSSCTKPDYESHFESVRWNKLFQILLGKTAPICHPK